MSNISKDRNTFNTLNKYELVIVKYQGNIYTSYEEMAFNLKATKWRDGRVLNADEAMNNFRVLGMCVHPDTERNIVLIESVITGNQFLFGEEGLVYVK